MFEVDYTKGKISRSFSPLTSCHFTEDFKGLCIHWLDDVDPAGGLSSQEQLMTVRGHLYKKKKKHVIQTSPYSNTAEPHNPNTISFALNLLTVLFIHDIFNRCVLLHLYSPELCIVDGHVRN